MGTDMTIPLNIDHLIKDYGSLRAVNDVSFQVYPGEIFGLLGPNGAGKTSIISTIVTLETPTSGKVEVFGKDVTLHPKQTKVHVGFVPQELINHGFFNIEEILRFHSGYYGLLHNKERIDYLLHRLSLWAHRKKKVKQLSGGMKRRLLIAKALVHSPKLLILDEPTAGVDIELRTALWDFVQELKQDGISVLLTTHYLEEAEQLCDRVAVIHQGQLQQIGETQSLVKSLTQRHIRLRLKELPSNFSHQYLVGQSEGVMDFQIPANMSVGDLMAEIRLDVRQVVDLQIQEGSLEDAFRLILGDKK